MTPAEILAAKLRLMDLQTFGTVKVAERQLEALTAAGYAVVPLESTDEMCHALGEALLERTPYDVALKRAIAAAQETDR